jgi:hypothetical protein
MLHCIVRRTPIRLGATASCMKPWPSAAEERACAGQDYAVPASALAQECNRHACPMFTFDITWSQCSDLGCDGGVKWAEVNCMDVEGRPVPDILCGGMPLHVPAYSIATSA